LHEGATYTLTDRESGEVLTLHSSELAAGFTFTLPKRTGRIYFYEF
jgi:hypothetical protein